MTALLARSVIEPRFRALLIALFAGLALALAAIGIYSVVSYTVTQRAHEIGLEIALGATHHRVHAAVLADTLKLVAPAAATGLVGTSLRIRPAIERNWLIGHALGDLKALKM